MADRPAAHDTAQDRLDAWRAEVRAAFVELHVEPTDPASFDGMLRRVVRGGLEAADIRAGGQRVERSKAAIRRSPSDHLYFVWQRSGTGLVQHEWGETLLTPGDTVLYNPDRPHALQFETSASQVCVKVPEAILRGCAPAHLDALLGQRLAASAGPARVLAAVTEALLDDPELGSDLLVADVFIDALGRSLRWFGEGGQPAPSPFQRGARMRRFIAEHHAHAGLSPADAAAALGCSLRQVHATCAQLGDSFGRLLLATRLEMAHHALARGQERRISTIAYDCGFADPAHFARAFKARYGATPRTVLFASGGR
jgi:AraC-like DNA-binding protein